MNASDYLLNNLQNFTTSTQANSQYSIATQTPQNDMIHILSYAIPLSCISIVIVILMAVVIHRRQRVLEKWSSLKRMRNTNPRFIEGTGLRRDSEYDSCSDGFENVAVINENRSHQNETDFYLATIT